ncbi:hypothetical protein GCE86_00385 [Micromonospora terminaliae]|uniref:Ribulose 1,5-bisphosphate carboxylase large subunit n=1 Tax=Micromonospora terminaliae TaxID=1914461 RepID=A0AAJ2ZL28_9ACTN|nr:hypothetical protein [Micromonospora terminaliae]NES31990.1 hypothetical protein [Micromonospora terminaliae]QGL45635.1 hypothetical protein GCE86_00385 [Micromonospora terminaliae]
MAIPLPRPGAVVGLTRSALDQAFGSAAAFAAVPARAFAVLDEVETLLRRINGVVDRIEGTLDRTDRVLDDAEAAVREVGVISAAATEAIETATGVATAAAVVVGEADRVARAAGTLVVEADAVATRAAGTVVAAEGAAGTAAELLAAYEPALRRAAPMATRFVEQLSPEEVTAAIRLVDELPKLKEHLTSDVLPILATLDRVGPDLHDLLAVTRDLKLAVAGIPGLGMLRRRGERLTDEPVD